jgi:peptidoglycan hydrolase CwlO-like protein
MTIELALVISGISLAFGIWQGISNMRRNNRRDDRSEAAQLTTVIVKLENISSGICEIKNEIANVKSDIKESREKIIRLEEAVKQAHKRIDQIEGR